MGRVASQLADFVIITCDNPRSEDPQKIISDILQGIDKQTARYKVILNRFQAIQEALANARSNDTVLIAGKGHEYSQIFADRIVPFSDQEAVKKILKHQ